MTKALPSVLESYRPGLPLSWLALSVPRRPVTTWLAGDLRIPHALVMPGKSLNRRCRDSARAPFTQVECLATLAEAPRWAHPLDTALRISLKEASMPVTSTKALPRRSLLLAGALGVASLASYATIAPAAAEETWTEEFMTRDEHRSGFQLDDMDEWQADNARLIMAVAKGHDIDAQGAKIALATAIVESWLYNLHPAVDHDSGGLFQQRPSQSWGSYQEVRHKKSAIEAFFGVAGHSEAPGLLQLSPDYREWGAGAAAQAVQISAHPERYAEQAAAAGILWDRYARDVDPYTD